MSRSKDTSTVHDLPLSPSTARIEITRPQSMSLRITLNEGVGAQIGEAYLAHLGEAATRALEGWIHPYPLLRPMRLSLPLAMRDAPTFRLTEVEGEDAGTLVVGFKCDLLIGPAAQVGVDIGTNPFACGRVAKVERVGDDLSLADLGPHARMAGGAPPALQSLAEDVLGPGARVQRPLSLSIAVEKLHISGQGRISLSAAPESIQSLEDSLFGDGPLIAEVELLGDFVRELEIEAWIGDDSNRGGVVSRALGLVCRRLLVPRACAALRNAKLRMRGGDHGPGLLELG